MLRLPINVNEYKEATGPISGDEYRTLAENYDRILAEGLAQLEKHNIIYGHQASDSGKLIKRLKKRRDEYLLFVRDSEVPFTNNLAERGFGGLRNRKKITLASCKKKGLFFIQDFCGIFYRFFSCLKLDIL